MIVAWLAFAALSPVTLAFGGDVMLGRGVEKAGVPPFGKAAGVLRGADLAFVNLECPLTERPFARQKVVNLRAKPARVAWLVDAGIDGVSVANNHTGDCGPEGLADTLDALGKAGIFAAGLEDKPIVREVRGVRFGFLALTDFPRDAAPGVAVLDPETLSAAISGLVKRVDHVVVSLHWGVEGYAQAIPRQRELAKRALAAGASAVIGTGPHVLQPLEGAVAYSLGDLVFDRTGERKVLLMEVQGKRATLKWAKF